VSNADPIVFLNGSYLPLQEARVSVLDRGFLFGDGVYEVIPVYYNKVFRLSGHLTRLKNSLAAIDIRNPHTDAEWELMFNEMVRLNPDPDDRSLYLEVTRGAGTTRDHLYTDSLVPTVFAMCRPITAKNYDKGISAITHEDIRWQYCHIKAVTLLPNIMLKQIALMTDGSAEAILLRDGFVTEGAASNVFVVKDGVVTTPPKARTILPGVTRDLLVELLHEAAVPCHENELTEQQLFSADEIWTTGSLAGIAPVVKLNGNQVGSGQPGTEWKKANQLFNEYKLRLKGAESSS
jgi:D-alanine transaminase